MHPSIMTMGDVMAASTPERGYYLRCVDQWRDYHRDRIGVCLCCCDTVERRTWPARFIFLRAYQSKRCWQVMAICLECASRSDLVERIKVVVKRMYPGLEEIVPPGRVQ